MPPIEVLEGGSRRDAHGYFNISHHEMAMRADVYLTSDDPLNAWAFAHGVTRTVDEDEVQLAPIEAVILSKLRYCRQGKSERHLDDIRRMLALSGDTLDRAEQSRWIFRLSLEREWRAVGGEEDQ